MRRLVQRRWRGRTYAFASAILSISIAMAGVVAHGQSPVDEKKIDDLISKMTLEEKIHMLSGASMMSSAGVERLGIPGFRMSDGPMGAHIPPPSTAYAAGIGLAASWDRDLANRVGTQIGRDARSRGAGYLYWGRA